jgi:glycosyltransferase involved in cell wall biosynthesis
VIVADESTQLVGVPRSGNAAAADLVTVVVLTLNEEANLPACLDSVRQLRASVIVVDSGSSDRTVEIAKRWGAAVVHHPFDGYALQRNWALDTLQIETDWILNLDADERLTFELVSEINGVLGNSTNQTDGYLLRKRTIFMGRWIRHGGHYPSYHLRLFRKGRGRCEARRYDQHFVADGAVECLEHDYHDVVASSLMTWTMRHAQWASMEASELLEASPNRGPRVVPRFAGNRIERRRWWRTVYGKTPIFVRALAYWGYRYVVRLGFLDATEGLIFHFLQGFWFRFLVDAMIYERAHADTARNPCSP